MPSDGIIKPGDVFEYVSASLRSCFVVLEVNLLAFQGAEKALHNGVVIAVAGATHADINLVVGQDAADLLAGVLAAAIGMME